MPLLAPPHPDIHPSHPINLSTFSPTLVLDVLYNDERCVKNHLDKRCLKYSKFLCFGICVGYFDILIGWEFWQFLVFTETWSDSHRLPLAEIQFVFVVPRKERQKQKQTNQKERKQRNKQTNKQTNYQNRQTNKPEPDLAATGCHSLKYNLSLSFQRKRDRNRNK